MEPIIEKFSGKYDAVVGENQPELLPEGAIAAGKNMRKVSSFGGWKPRKGYSLLNTTAGGDKIISIHGFKNELGGDYHLISQISNTLKDSTTAIEDLITTAGEIITTQDGEFVQVSTSGESFEQAATIGSTLFTGCSPIVRGTSDIIGKKWIYADGSGMPVVYGGLAGYPKAFFLVTSGGDLIEYSSEIRDKSDDSYAVIPATSTVYYVVSSEQLSGVYLYFGTNKNTNAVTVTVAIKRSGSWTNVSSQVDNTDGSETHDTDGSIEWTASSADELSYLGNTHGYVYRFTFSGVPTAIDITRVRVIAAAQRMTLKWDEIYRYLSAVNFYDASKTDYECHLGSVSNTSKTEYLDISLATTSDFLYLAAPEPISVFGIGVIAQYENTADAEIDSVEVYDSGSWTSVGFTDTTKDGGGDSSFGQSGRIYLDSHTASRTVHSETGCTFAQYWYRLSWDASLSSDVRIYLITYGAQPKDYEKLDGVVEFRGRAFYWGHPEYPNRLILSPYAKPDQVCGLVSGDNLSYPFGDGGEIRAAGVLQDVLVVVKDKGIFYTEDGITPITVNANVGVINAASFVVASYGDRTMNEEQVQSVAMWQDTDGTYKFDKTGLSKVSSPVDTFFNQLYDSAIDSEDYEDLCAMINPNSNEYHLTLPTQELVYSLAWDEWYPAWERALPLTAIRAVKDQDDRFRLVGGTAGGFLLLLEETDNDRDSSNDPVAIEQSITTRTFTHDVPVLDFAATKLWINFVTKAYDSIVVTSFKDHETTGTVEDEPEEVLFFEGLTTEDEEVLCGEDGERFLTEGSIDGDTATVVEHLDLNFNRIGALSFSFSLSALDSEMWINWIGLMLDSTQLHHGE